MRSRYYFGFISFALLIFLSGCKNEKNNYNEETQLKKTLACFYEYVNTGQTDKRLDLYADSAVIMPDNSDLLYFTNDTKARWKSFDEEWIFRIKDLERIKLEIVDSTAYVINKYFYTFHSKLDSADWKKTKNIHIWKKQKSGDWKLFADIWNNCE